jgi:hypothetical protein
MYRLLFLCQNDNCGLLQSLHYLSVFHIEMSLYSGSLITLPSLTVCPLSVSTSHCTICFFVCHVNRGFLQSVHRLSVPHTAPSLGPLSLWPIVFLDFFHWLSVPHTVPSVGSVSPCPFLFYYDSPISVSNSYSTLCWICSTMTTAAF